ncbi:MAG: sulfatase-like hydrolase/transferase [Candidatus Muiribacteriota bacterium]
MKFKNKTPKLNLKKILVLNYFFIFAVFILYSAFLFNKTNPYTISYFLIAASAHSFSILLLLYPFYLITNYLSPGKKTAGLIISLLTSAVIIFFIINYKVFLQYRFHINMEVMNLIFVGGGDIFSFPLSTVLYGLFIISAVLAAELFIVFKFRFPGTINKKIKASFISVVLLSFFSAHFIHAYADARNFRYITTSAHVLPYFSPLTAKGFFEKHNLIETVNTKTLSDKNFKSQLNYPPKELKFNTTSNATPNILFIVNDCLRSDMVQKDIMPFVFNFAKKNNSLTFKNHLSGGNGSRIGIFSLFYGLMGTYWNSIADENISPILIDTIQKNNYKTGIFGSATLKSPPLHKTVFSGIQDLRIESEGSTSSERDLDITQDWMEWIDSKNNNQPFFGFMFYDSAHSLSFPDDFKIKNRFKPYARAAEYHKFDGDYDNTKIKNRYKISLAYTDTLIEKVIKDLKEKNILKNTIVIITGDHGEEFNESGNNFWGHGGNFTDYQVKVPLIIHWPGKEKKEFNHLTSHHDVAPTLLTEVFGCNNSPEEISNGRNLFNKSNREWVFSGGFSKKAVIEKDRITVSYPTGFYEIYNRNFDPLEDAELKPEILKEVMKERSKFYKK